MNPSESDSAAVERASVSKPSRPFPTPPLVILSVASCFLASAALVSSVTAQATIRFGYRFKYVVPTIIACAATVSYHVLMYHFAKAHRRHLSPSNTIFISNNWILYNFLLVTLWALTFALDVLLCYRNGINGVLIMSTISSGTEWIILLYLAIFTIVEICRSEPSAQGSPETEPLLPGTPEVTRSAFGKKLIYLFSYTLCSVTLILGAIFHTPVLFNVIAFFLTAPHHIALYISSARPNSPFIFSPISHPTSVIYSFLLSAVWFGVTILNFTTPRLLYQSILFGVFGGLECATIVHLTFRSVLNVFSEGQISL